MQSPPPEDEDLNSDSESSDTDSGGFSSDDDTATVIFQPHSRAAAATATVNGVNEERAPMPALPLPSQRGSAIGSCAAELEEWTRHQAIGFDIITGDDDNEEQVSREAESQLPAEPEPPHEPAQPARIYSSPPDTEAAKTDTLSPASSSVSSTTGESDGKAPKPDPLFVPEYEYDSDTDFHHMMMYLEEALAADLRDLKVSSKVEAAKDEEEASVEDRGEEGARFHYTPTPVEELLQLQLALSIPASEAEAPVTEIEDTATAAETEAGETWSIHALSEDSEEDAVGAITSATTPESEEQPNGSLARFTIFETPHPDIIQQTLQCRVCGEVRPPPYYQCEVGHLICEKDAAKLEGMRIRKKAGPICNGGGGDGSEIETQKNMSEAAVEGQSPRSSEDSSPSPTPTLLGLIVFPTCPVRLLQMEGQATATPTTLCGATVIKETLNLYTELYDACEMNCPRMDLGCKAKVLGAELKKHLREDCFYNVVVKCQNSYCSVPVQQCEYLKHLRETHRIQFFNGTANSIKIWHERLKYTDQLKRMANGAFGYDWIAAVIDFDHEHFVLRVHEEQQSFLFWVQRIKTTPEQESRASTPETAAGDDDGRLRKLLGIGNSTITKQESPEPQQQPAIDPSKKKVYWSRFLIRNPQTGASHKWMGQVAPPGCATTKIIDSQEFFQLYKTCLEKKYMRGTGHSFEMQLELKVQAKKAAVAR